MSMQPLPAVERSVRQRTVWRHAALPFVAFALAPKCVLCGFAYVGLGTLIGLADPDLCGGANLPAKWSDWLVWVGIVPGLISGVILARMEPVSLSE